MLWEVEMTRPVVMEIIQKVTFHLRGDSVTLWEVEGIFRRFQSVKFMPKMKNASRETIRQRAISR
jgi:hypothetical protein